MKNRLVVLMLLFLAINPLISSAAPIRTNGSLHTLSDISKGWYAVDNGDGPGIDIVPLAGFLSPDSNNEYRGYFVFDLSGIEGHITGAKLQVRRGSQSLPLTFGLWDVTTPAGAIMTYAPGEHIRNQIIWNDLGSGKSYGTFSAPVGDADDRLEFTLDKHALDDLGNSSGLFAIGASLLNPKNDNGAYIFGGDDSYPGSWTENSYLILDVKPIPEPTTTALLLAGISGLFGLRYKRIPG